MPNQDTPPPEFDHAAFQQLIANTPGLDGYLKRQGFAPPPPVDAISGVDTPEPYLAAIREWQLKHGHNFWGNPIGTQPSQPGRGPVPQPVKQPGPYGTPPAPQQAPQQPANGGQPHNEFITTAMPVAAQFITKYGLDPTSAALLSAKLYAPLKTAQLSANGVDVSPWPTGGMEKQ